ncbi:MAG: DUF2510 domain-containing protein [Actinobacteria bacterium]|nr:MAG: DUF2510 domain-containing protein [Actinomycetota bacterium]
MSRQGILAWALVSATVVVIGAFGPWVTALGVVSISGTTVSKHPYILAGLGLIGAAFVWVRRATNVAGVGAMLVGVAAGALSLYDRHHLSSLLHSAGPIGSAFVHIGWGLNATLAGSVSLLLSGVAWFLFVTDEADEWRKRAAAAPVTTGAPVVPAGWYRDPNDDAMLRYWNGFGWTTQTAKPAS